MLGLEHRRQKLLPHRRFRLRLARWLVAALALTLLALGGGMLGYHYLENLTWLDAFLNASMILGGMGPVDPMHTAAGKLFSGLYALFSGWFCIILAGLILTPIAHRLLHRFHLEESSDSEKP